MIHGVCHLKLAFVSTLCGEDNEKVTTKKNSLLARSLLKRKELVSPQPYDKWYIKPKNSNLKYNGNSLTFKNGMQIRNGNSAMNIRKIGPQQRQFNSSENPFLRNVSKKNIFYHRIDRTYNVPYIQTNKSNNTPYRGNRVLKKNIGYQFKFKHDTSFETKETKKNYGSYFISSNKTNHTKQYLQLANSRQCLLMILHL